MRKNGKKLLSLALALVMVLAMLPVSAFAASAGMTIQNGVLYRYTGFGGDVVIPNGVTRIEDGAFQDCAGLTSVTIPASVTSIGMDLFSGCSDLTAIQVDPNNPILTSVDGVMFSKDMVYLLAYPGGKQGAYTIPSGVKRVEIFAFSLCSKLTGVTFPDSLVAIGDGAFQGCSGLTEMTIPATILEMDTGVFAGCTGLTAIQVDPNSPILTSVDGVVFTKDMEYLLAYPSGKQGAYTIPDGVKGIDTLAFSHSGMTSVGIPTSVTEIGQYAFNYTRSLKDVYYAGTQAQWNGISIEKDGNSLLLNANIHYSSEGSAGTGFADVSSSAYYRDSVYWAVEQKITNGTSETTFTPDRTCTETEILTFLWRAAGQPSSSAQLPFTLNPGLEYAEGALRWAYEKGMIGAGYSQTASCTRASAAKFIWQASDSPAASAGSSFSDVPASADYAPAVAWAVSKEITNGTGTNPPTFSPDKTCTRAEIVTFLYRAYQ